jgi:hypothetical protein
MWIDYCRENNIPYKIVDCYSTDVISQLFDCDALMWHFSQNSPKAILFGKQLIYSIAAAGKISFPDFNTIWHFDDKVGQKYLLEAIEAPIPESWVFYEKEEAISWAKESEFPKVFKLRGGASSQNVKLVTNRNVALKLISQAFGKGFSAYDPWGSLKERYRRYQLGKSDLQDLLEGVARFVIPPPYSRIRGREKGYIYFQEFIAGNNFDIRIIVIDDKAFGIKRLVRNNDFRASGSGNILYDRDLFDKATLQLAFELAKKLKSQCIAFDFIYRNGNPLVVEISYGFSSKGYDPCPGYWDKELTWHEGVFNPYGWMVEGLLKQLKREGK